MANAAPLLVYLRAIDLPLASTIEKISPTPEKMTRETVRKARYGRF